VEQRTLFDDPPGDGDDFCDRRLDPAARPRLSRQCRLILARLRRGPATNRELAALALKYTGRISDLRKRGHDVRLLSQDHESGVAVYGLVEGNGTEK
jgi:hypothetical protein